MIGLALFEQSERTTQRVRGHLALFVGHTLGVDFEPQMSHALAEQAAKNVETVLVCCQRTSRPWGALDEAECFIDATFVMAKGGGAEIGHPRFPRISRYHKI
jgi:hypothetical protein